ncbi:MAG: hypothetical protein QXW47_10190 [Candidatus Jordarchaeales archaeon]
MWWGEFLLSLYRDAKKLKVGAFRRLAETSQTKSWRAFSLEQEVQGELQHQVRGIQLHYLIELLSREEPSKNSSNIEIERHDDYFPQQFQNR